MTRLAKAAIATAVLLAAVLYFTRPEMSEAQRVEAEAGRMNDYIRLLNTSSERKSPRLLFEMALMKKGTDPRQHFLERFNQGLDRLHELGVLQKRSFQFFDTNGAPVKVAINDLFPTNDILWVVGYHTNYIYEVLATPAAMKRWEKFGEKYKSGGTNFASP